MTYHQTDLESAWNSFCCEALAYKLLSHVDESVPIFRHVKFTWGESDEAAWEVVTWSRHLAVHGENGLSLIFEGQDEDLLPMFDTSEYPALESGAPLIKPLEWAQSLTGNPRVKTYSRGKFLELVGTLADRNRSVSEADAHAILTEAEEAAGSESKARQFLNSNDLGDSESEDLHYWSPKFLITCYALQVIAARFLHQG